MIFGPWPGFGPSIAAGRHHPSLGHEPQASWVIKMFSVIFEVHPKKERFGLYLALAKDLKPILEGIDGFVDNERFERARRPGWVLSHSTWRDEKSVVRWRTVAKHHETQQRGRDEVFQDYHLRVGEVVSDTAPQSVCHAAVPYPTLPRPRANGSLEIPRLGRAAESRGALQLSAISQRTSHLAR